MSIATVSVVVATYHRGEELYNALMSLSQQTYPKIEAIVIDDSAAREWNEKVSSVIKKVRSETDLSIQHIVNEKNKGSAATRNVGIDAAKGDYITFLDDDDIYLPEKIEMQLADMISADADFGMTDLYLYDLNDHLVDRRIRNYIENTSMEELFRYHLMYHMTGTDTLMFKKSYLKSIGGFPGIDVGDEFYLMKEAILHKGKFVYSPHCYVKAYVHTGESSGLSSGQGKIDGENALFDAKKKYFSQLNKADVGYIKTRHYAVIAFAELRRRSLVPFLVNAGLSFVSSPIGCIQILMQHKASLGKGSKTATALKEENTEVH